MRRKPETIAFWVGRLPHWEVVDGRYFVTLHLSGAIPKRGHDQIRQISAELELLKPGDHARRLIVQRKIFREMEAWLDRADHVTHLREPDVAKMIVEAINRRVELRQWNVFEYVVMPSHLHLFFELDQGRLKTVLEDFKQWTGRQAAKFVKFDTDKFWHREWFDHWSRSDDEDERIVQYIRHNPVKAGLVEAYEQWPYGSWMSHERKERAAAQRTPVPPGRRDVLRPAGRTGDTP
jgi:REP element-mobilizing transposase RayT